MPPRGPMGPGRGFGPFMGGIPANSTMTTANQVYDWNRTVGRPQPVGPAGHGYVKPSAFSFRELFHRVSLAWDYSIRTNGATRFRSFVGNFQYLNNGAAKYARFSKMVESLDEQKSKETIDLQTYGNRVMYEAVSYYGYMRDKTIITEEEYREKVQEFAESKGIDFSFGEPARSR